MKKLLSLLLSALVAFTSVSADAQWLPKGPITKVPVSTSQGGTGATSFSCAFTNFNSVLSLTSPINQQGTNTAYTISTSDMACGVIVHNSNGTSVADSLAAATTSGYGGGTGVTIFNAGTSSVTITPTTSTINGVTSWTINKNSSVTIISDGTNYWALSAAGGPNGNLYADGTGVYDITTVGNGPSLYLYSTVAGTHNWNIGTNTQGAVFFFDVTANKTPFFVSGFLLNELAGGVYGWSSNTTFNSTTADTGLSRDTVAGTIDVGTGAAQSSAGLIKAAAHLAGGTKFTTSGCAISSTTGGATAGKMTSGTTGACTVVITLGGASAPNGWHCSASDETTGLNLSTTAGASSATTCTVTGTTTTGDTISFLAVGF